MSWFFVDDGFYDHPKLSLLSPDQLAAAAGLWVLAGSWSRKKLTGGEIPYHQVARLGCTQEQAESLVECGLWERSESGYRFHNWARWQETPDELEAMRIKARARVQKWRDKKRAQAGKSKPVRKAKRGNASVTLPVTLQETSQSRHGDVDVTAAYRVRERERDVRGEASREVETDALEAQAVRDEAAGRLGGGAL